MLSKEEYIELYIKGGQAINAILEVLNNLAEVKVEIAGEEAIKIIRDFQQKYFDLINEHFKPKENTSEFKHFKLHSDSTLKNQTKKELIDYIKMLYHNWGACDEQLKRVIDKAKELSDSNDELRRQLYFIEPYKFEDLKPNMWVYDIKVKWLFKIVSVDIGIEALKHYVFIVENRDGSTSLINFEENRFFPVQCANLEIEN
ncbi:hypothetical protein [Thomasclavelia ramosa]|uniref:hypothetical protein n=1 Tax=Thomasclavelia ramosa TaxID=1547 RepID=UPI0022DF2181|nr:hypothetical protein [Thomasclavelia ramosa]